MQDAPFKRRIAGLFGLVNAINRPSIRYVETTEVRSAEAYDALHVQWINDGYEGSMWRDHNSLYELGKRSKSLLKRKDFDDAEFEIVEIQEGEGNWAGAAKRVVCWLPNADRSIDLADKKAREENTFEAGLRGKFDANAQLLAERDQHKVVTIRYFGFTPSAIPKPRFGVATRFHGAARTL
jgi:DNA ligase-1